MERLSEKICTNPFSAPAEVGVHNFVVKYIFEEKIGGIAFYAIQLTTNQ